MVRVEIQNFQSIASEVVEIDGFAAIVGRSNIGKSAVVRAVRAALTGPPADAYVRHGEGCARLKKGSKKCKCFCSVRIKAEGFDLLWEKGDAVNQYTFNGQMHTVAGRGTPDFLPESLTPVKIGSNSPTLLQVSNQFNPIFLLDQSGTAVADVLSDVVKLDQINTAMRLVEKDRKAANSTRKVRLKDVEDLKTSLVRYEGLDTVLKRITEATEKADKQDALESKVARMEKFISTAVSVANTIKALTPIADVRTPDAERVVQSQKGFNNLTSLARSFENRTQAVEVLGPVESIAIPDTDDLAAKVMLHRKLLSWSDRLLALKTYFDTTKAASSKDVPDLGSLPSKQKDLSRFRKWVRAISELTEEVNTLKADLEGAVNSEAEIRAELDSLGVCPTCKRPLGQEVCHV